MADKVLSVARLQKSIRKKRLIHDITFDVRAGEVFGFLGPNGAGKTTTIRMLVGLTKPDAGEIKIGGYSLQNNFLKAIDQVGCIVENPELYPFLTGQENLEMLARMSKKVSSERIREVVELVELTGAIHERVKTYSLGMRQRLGIAQALLHRPRLLILDEPTNGLDPAGIRELRQFIRRLALEERIGVFISSHMLSEIELMCDRVAIINKGRVISIGQVKELMEQFADQVNWKFIDDNLPKAVELMQASPHVYELMALSDGRVKCRMDTDKIAEVNRALILAGVHVTGIEEKAVTLEDLFLTLTQDKSLDEEGKHA
ncbi:ABC transporter ATP-binding protein [Brevibacillus laterosporus]|uniref:ABC transporter ATP-binding protein n=1 Tax=Brevibacillus laterosporus TaxID=1465 RepID=A0AAP3DKF2_BRELA|nr:ABC transporter ATP-binding protein [Brevibacillus laterosporus]MCR8982953.1 ABC transporter ATP-binding protein [Brevibacillus laterosporus]MCZ0810109.1 ABC transporter ATP-binding protein [Brevibacillus laterosporus]MCZ0828717.1 ABC transporter ATP-binding protein [Brevibacillus laterosporus]MCZ0852731.1 ABC transporter ATP-binding protein [Brevibacillus laterosporus]